MALYRIGDTSKPSGLQPNKYFTGGYSGFSAIATYTDGTAITVPSSNHIASITAGIAGKSTVTTSNAAFYCITKKDGTISSGTSTANTPISVDNGVEIQIFEPSNSTVASYTVTIA